MCIFSNIEEILGKVHTYNKSLEANVMPLSFFGFPSLVSFHFGSILHLQ